MTRRHILISILAGLTCIVSSVAIRAQLLQRTNLQSDGFRLQVQRFEEFRRTHKLDTMKGWKFYKRWEHEQLMHTVGNGRLDNFEDYHHALLVAAQQKMQAKFLFTNDHWISIGPEDRPDPEDSTMQNGMGRVNCIAFHPTDSATYYVGVAQGGIWKTTDDGQSWRVLSDRLPITRVSDIAVDPVHPNTVYAALGDYEYIQFGLLQYGRKRNTYFGIGLYKSTDGGETWSATGLGRSLYEGEASLLCKVLIHPINPSILLVAGTTGIFYSSDAGKSWSQRDTSLMWDLEADPSDPNVVYASCGHLMMSGIGRARILKSHDFGYSWTALNCGIPEVDTVERIKLAISPSNSKVLYAACTDRYYGLYAIYRSTNAGLSWTKRFDSLNILQAWDGHGLGGQGSYDLCMQVNATNPDELYVGGVNLWASNDGASSFKMVSFWTANFGQSIHADQHLMAYQKLSGSYFICNDGGVARTKKMYTTTWDSLVSGVRFTTQWTPVTRGMSISSFYRVSSSHTSDGRVLAGAQDNSSAWFFNKKWNGVIGGDGMDNWISPETPGAAIGSSQYGSFSRTLDGLHWNDIFITNEPGEWTTPIVACYRKPGLLFTAYENVFQSQDTGSSWTRISNFPYDSVHNAYQEASALAVSGTNPEVLMVCRRIHIEKNLPSTCWRTNDGEFTWYNVTQGLPDSLYFTGVEIAADNPNLAWVSCAGMVGGVKVFRTTDGGASWKNISYDLPNLPVNVVKCIPGSQRHLLMVGTDVGIYVINDSSTHWISYSSSLPNVIVSDLEINEAANEMICSTFGRGLWKTELIYDLPIEVGVLAEADSRECDVYPSPAPAGTTLKIRLHTQTLGTLSIDVCTLHGKLLRSMQQTKDRPDLDVDLTPDLPAGAYFIRLHCGSWQAVRKVMIN